MTVADMTNDFKYFITCKRKHNINENWHGEERISFQCEKALERTPGDWYGGFNQDYKKVIFYPDYDSAKIVCDLFQARYAEYTIKVITKSTKEIFVERLTDHE